MNSDEKIYFDITPLLDSLFKYREVIDRDNPFLCKGGYYLHGTESEMVEFLIKTWATIITNDIDNWITDNPVDKQYGWVTKSAGNNKKQADDEKPITESTVDRDKKVLFSDKSIIESLEEFIEDVIDTGFNGYLKLKDHHYASRNEARRFLIAALIKVIDEDMEFWIEKEDVSEEELDDDTY